MRRPTWLMILVVLLACEIAPSAICAQAASNEQDWLEHVIVQWMPMLLLVGVWIYFMRNMDGRSGKGYYARQMQYWERSEKHMERIEALLERVVSALERK